MGFGTRLRDCPLAGYASDVSVGNASARLTNYAEY